MNVLIFLLVACAVMAAAVWALNRRALSRLPSVSQFDSYIDLGPDRYRYLSRLFAPEDFDFLAGVRGGQVLLSRLRRERRRLLRLLLADLRRDFEALLAVGSLLSLSPTAKDDGYAELLARQSLRFYALYYFLSMISLWPGPWPLGYDHAVLWQQIKALRASTQFVMRALTPDDLLQMRRTLGAES